jgi:flavin reductase (DIM6/NTAB) family NADH-FMN oxidoreductase RutF
MGGAPRLAGSVAWLDCTRAAMYPGGDHSILVGTVVDGATGSEDDPLVFFTGNYTSLTWG